MKMELFSIAKADKASIDSNLEDNNQVRILIKSLICKMVRILS